MPRCILHRVGAGALIFSLLLTLAVTTQAAPPVGTPVPAATGDGTVPFDAPHTAQVGGKTIQTAAIRTAHLADGREAVADRVIVGFKPGVTDADKGAVHTAVGRQSRTAATPKALKQVNDDAQYVDVTGAPSLDAAVQAYQADPRVAYAEPDVIMYTTETPNDPDFTHQYGMRTIHAPAAWDVTHGAASVKIAILDCGIYEAHPDLVGKVVGHQDFTGSAYGTDDRCNHGTFVAGIASANTNNGTGVAGVGYATSLLNGKVLLEQYDTNGNLIGGSGSTTWVAAGIRWAADNGAKVINMSLGAAGACSQTYQNAVDYAWNKGVVIIAAAGNNNSTQLFQPASCTHVVAVASTDESDARSGFSDYGTWVQVAAPGSDIFSSLNPTIAENDGQAYGSGDGTSFASPHVAGLAGLVWATGFGTSAQAVVTRLENTADRIAGTGTNWQYGRINAQAAVGAPGPVTAALSPASVAPGTAAFTLTVTGTNFQPGATVRWNGTPRTTVYLSATQLTAAIRATDVAAAGTASITVANPDGGVSSPALTFAITTSPPHPLSLSPAMGSTGGGTIVTIAGTDFRTGATVTFGGVAARVTAVTATAITAVAPAHVQGGVSVVVTNPDGQQAAVPAGYTYIPEPDARAGTSVAGMPAPAPTARTGNVPVDSSLAPPPASAPVHR